MLLRIRIEGTALSADELTREFEVMAAHFCSVGYLEGVVPGQIFPKQAVVESMMGEDEFNIAGHRFAARWKGRQTFEFAPHEGDFAALRPRPLGQNYEVVAVFDEGERVVQEQTIVVQRQYPYRETESVSLKTLHEEKVEEYLVSVWESGEDPAMPGWTTITCQVTESGKSALADWEGVRVTTNSTCRIEEREAEALRLFETQMAYVNGILAGREGTSPLNSGYLISRGIGSAQEPLDAITEHALVERIVVNRENGLWEVFAYLVPRRDPSQVSSPLSKRDVSLHAAASDVYTRLRMMEEAE